MIFYSLIPANTPNAISEEKYSFILDFLQKEIRRVALETPA